MNRDKTAGRDAKSTPEAFRMWPSEISASHIYNVATFVLIASLACGVIGTILVTWMGNVKEGYLKQHLADTQLETARLQRSNLELQRNVRGREITDQQYERITAATKGMKIPDLVTYIVHDPEATWYALSLVSVFQDLGMKGRVVFLQDQPPSQTGVMYCGTGTEEDAAFMKALADAGIVSVGAPTSNFGHDQNGQIITLPYCPPGSIFVGLRPPLSTIRSPVANTKSKK